MMHALVWLQICSTSILVLNLPIHTRFFAVFRSEIASKSISRSFRLFQLNITCLNILFTVTRLMIHDMAFFGFATDFYKYNKWLAYINHFVEFIFHFGTTFFHLLVGANQTTAVRFPFRHVNLWRYKNLIGACVITWIFATIPAIPFTLMVPTCEVRRKVQVVAYLLASILVHVTTLCCYALLIRNVQKSQIDGQKMRTIPLSVRKSCEVAAITNIGSLVTYFVLILLPIFWKFKKGEKREVTIDVIFTLMYTFKSAVIPWAMLAMYPKIRLWFLGRLTTVSPRNTS